MQSATFLRVEQLTNIDFVRQPPRWPGCLVQRLGAGQLPVAQELAVYGDLGTGSVPGDRGPFYTVAITEPRLPPLHAAGSSCTGNQFGLVMARNFPDPLRRKSKNSSATLCLDPADLCSLFTRYWYS